MTNHQSGGLRPFMIPSLYTPRFDERKPVMDVNNTYQYQTVSDYYYVLTNNPRAWNEVNVQIIANALAAKIAPDMNMQVSIILENIATGTGDNARQSNIFTPTNGAQTIYSEMSKLLLQETYDGFTIYQFRVYEFTKPDELAGQKRKYEFFTNIEDFLKNPKQTKNSLFQIHNNDNDCVYIAAVLGLAIHTGKSVYESLSKKYRDSERAANPTRLKEVNDLRKRYAEFVKQPISAAPLEFHEIALLETCLDVQITIVDGDAFCTRYTFPQSGSFNHILFYHKTQRSGKPHIAMLKAGKHVHFIKSLSGLLDAEAVCLECTMVYKKKRGHDCNHVTPADYSKPSLDWIKGDEKKCKKRIQKLMSYDIETITVVEKEQRVVFTEGHTPNLIRWRLTDLRSETPQDQPDVYGCMVLLRHGGTFAPADNCETIVVEDHLVDAFVKLVSTDKRFKDTAIFAHNGGGYDNRFIFESYIRNRRSHHVTFFNSRIYRLHGKDNNVKWMDSYLHLSAPLASFPKTWGLTSGLLKGDYPHKFNTEANMTYIGPMPSVEYWDLEFKNPEKALEIEKWHEDCVKNGRVWNNLHELDVYCKVDVDILHLTLLKYRQMLLTMDNIDPLVFTTVSSMSWHNYRYQYMQHKLIYQERPLHSMSIAEHAWRTKIEEERGYVFERNVDLRVTDKERNDALQSIGMPKCPNCKGYLSIAKASNHAKTYPNRLYYARNCCGIVQQNWHALADGVDPALHDRCLEINKKHKIKSVNVDAYDRETNTAYLYHGCRYHGCPKCDTGRQLPDHEEKLAATLRNQKLLEDSEYNLVICWGCEDTTEAKYRDSYINLRLAMHGGHTEVYAAWCDIRGTLKQILYMDIASEYPAVNALDIYPCGMPTFYSGNQLFAACKRQPTETNTEFLKRILYKDGFCGFFRLDVALQDTKIPFIPTYHDKKLTFANGDLKDKIIYSEELKYAFDVGQIKHIVCIKGAVKYKAVRGPMKKYVSKWFAAKTRAGGTMTQEECDAFNEQCVKQGLDIHIKPEECVKNPGMKSLCKQNLNSPWGKTGQRNDLPKSVVCTTPQQLHRIIHDPEVTASVQGHGGCLDDDNQWVEVKYKRDTYNAEASDITNVAFAAATTANGRVRLHRMLRYVAPDQMLYCDTDSAIIVYDPDNAEHKDMKSVETLATHGLTLGKWLGGWEHEHCEDTPTKKERIVAYTATGPKSYILVIETKTWNQVTGQWDVEITEDVKCKGVTLTKDNAQKITFETELQLAKGTLDKIKTKGMSMVKHGMFDGIRTTELPRTKQRNITKRKLDEMTGQTEPLVIHQLEQEAGELVDVH